MAQREWTTEEVWKHAQTLRDVFEFGRKVISDSPVEFAAYFATFLTDYLDHYVVRGWNNQTSKFEKVSSAMMCAFAQLEETIHAYVEGEDYDIDGAYLEACKIAPQLDWLAKRDTEPGLYSEEEWQTLFAVVPLPDMSHLGTF